MKDCSRRDLEDGNFGENALATSKREINKKNWTATLALQRWLYIGSGADGIDPWELFSSLPKNIFVMLQQLS